MEQLFDVRGFTGPSTTDEDSPTAPETQITKPARRPKRGRHLQTVGATTASDRRASPAMAASRSNSGTEASPVQWQLDAETIATGRRGIAMAREALRKSTQGNSQSTKRAA